MFFNYLTNLLLCFVSAIESQFILYLYYCDTITVVWIFHFVNFHILVKCYMDLLDMYVIVSRMLISFNR